MLRYTRTERVRSGALVLVVHDVMKEMKKSSPRPNGATLTRNREDFSLVGIQFRAVSEEEVGYREADRTGTVLGCSLQLHEKIRTYKWTMND